MSKNQQRKRFWRRRMLLPMDTGETLSLSCVLKALLWTLVAVALLLALVRSAGGAEARSHSSILAHSSIRSWSMPESRPEMVELKMGQNGGTENGVDWSLVCLMGVMLATPLVVWLAVRRQRRNEVELPEEVCCSRFSVSGGRVTPSSFPEPPPVKSFTEFDPLTSEALISDSLACEAPRILGAVAEELRLIRGLVQGARRTMCEDDYSDALASAEERLGQVRVTVTELAYPREGGAAVL